LKHAKPDQLTFQNAAINYLAPIDDSRVLYTARGPDGTGPWLWEHDVNTHVTEQVRLGPNPCVAVSASADGRIVAATLAEYPTVGLYSVPIRDNGMAKEIDVKPFEVQGTRPHAPRFDESGKSMFYLSASKAFDGLSLMRNGKDSVILDGSNVALFEPPAVSRDGKRVVIVVRQGGLRRLEIRSDEGIAGSALNTSITVQGSAGQSVADWGPGNEWIVVGGSDDEGKGLFKIPVGEGKGDRHEVLVRGPATNPVVSPKGDLIVYAGPLGKGQSELGFVTPDGQPVPSLTGMHLKVRPGGSRFLPDGSGLVFTRIQGPLDFFLLDLRTRSSDRQLAQLGSKGRISTFDVTPDKRIVFDRTIENSAIFLIDHI
jgi:hypothetical protein